MLLEYDDLVLYRSLTEDDVLRTVCDCMRDRAAHNEEGVKRVLESALSRLVAYCEERGLGGDLWAAYLTDLMVNAENVYTYACERYGSPDSSMDALMLHDMEVMSTLYHTDIRGMLAALELTHLECIYDYTPSDRKHIYSARIRDAISALSSSLLAADDAPAMKDILTDFYKDFGVGSIGLHRAFGIEADENGRLVIVPVLRMMHMTLDDLIGYENAKRKLIDNTEAFLAGRPANNCLLYGDAGTGKSSCIRALATQYYDRGLRIIQVKRDQFKLINELISTIKYRNYRFIIYMDDLSFEDFETDYKYLKAIIEGGLDERPDNMLIYATSNRRHLIRETVSDRDDRDEDMHRSDTMAEKLSLSQRFGVSIYFGSPDKKEFNSIVRALADRDGIVMPDDELILEANKWELSHGGLSGRTARQFIDHLLGCTERSDP